MNARFTTHMNYPRVDIIPSGDFHAFGGMIEVHFLKLDRETGKQELAPFIRANVNFGDLTPDEARSWAKVLEVAGELASNRPRPTWSDAVDDARRAAWVWLRDNGYWKP